MTLATYTLPAPKERQYGSAPSVGLDIGSRATKGVLLADGKVTAVIVPSGVSTKETSRQVLSHLLDAAHLKQTDVECLVGTGYGRIVIEFSGIPTQIITEISCHAIGAFVINPSTQTVIDIGGQDSKAMNLPAAERRGIEDFSVKSLCMRGNTSPAPPVGSAPRGGVLNPKRATPFNKS